MSTSSASGAARADGWFVTTHWSLVLSAQDTASPRSVEALETLCRTYWLPLYIYIRQRGHSPADAEDLTQGFFARLLEKGYLHSVAAEKGRFRTFLLTALKRFMANQWDYQHAQKRGGFCSVVSLDQHLAEANFDPAEAHDLSPDRLFDRHWAMTLLDAAMTRLRQEYTASGRAMLFEHLHPCLAREASALPYSELADRLHLTEAAIKMAVHRLRARYREILREQVAQTVASPEATEQELRDLFLAFGG